MQKFKKKYDPLLNVLNNFNIINERHISAFEYFKSLFKIIYLLEREAQFIII